MQHKNSNSKSNNVPALVFSALLLFFGCGLLSPSNGVDAPRSILPQQAFFHTALALLIGIAVYGVMLVIESIKNQ